jgi:NAD-dependent deacetylase
MDRKKDFYDYYFDKLLVTGIKPNKAHIKLAEMEAAGKLTAIVTQNIDGLHQMAGSKNVFELHGSVHRNHCEKCHTFYDGKYMLDHRSDGIPKCEKCGGDIKPDVVLYEEGLDQRTIEQAVRHINDADMLIIGGTSLAVYPAAGLIDYFRGKYLVLINKSATIRDAGADLIINEPIGETLEKIRV